MNLACLVSFMTFHFFLNLAFHAIFFSCQDFNLGIYHFKKKLKLCASQPAQTEHF